MLTAENYYSPEANQKYMSNSQYKDFLTCESMALAKLEGRFSPAPSIDYLVGSYLHAWNEGTDALEHFKANTPDLFTKKGELRSNFLFADTMIEALTADAMCMDMLQGQKEAILTAEFFGTLWKIKIDTYKPSEAIVDLKTTRSIWDFQYVPRYGEKVSFIDQYDYFTQIAIYLETELRANNRDEWLSPYIVAVSKETPPDKAIFLLDDCDRIEGELERIRLNMPRILEVKAGFVEPNSCGRCAYCRSTKTVNRIIPYSELLEVS